MEGDKLQEQPLADEDKQIGSDERKHTLNAKEIVPRFVNSRENDGYKQNMYREP